MRLPWPPSQPAPRREQKAGGCEGPTRDPQTVSVPTRPVGSERSYSSGTTHPMGVGTQLQLGHHLSRGDRSAATARALVLRL